MLAKYRVFLKAGWASMLEYRVSVLVGMAFSWLPLLPLAVWLSIMDGSGPINGYSRDELVSYFLAAVAMRQIIVVWIGWTLPAQINQGELSPKLLRPIHPIHQEIAGHLAQKLVTIPVLLVFIVPVALLFGGVSYAGGVASIPALIASVAGAWGITFFANYSLALLAFWMTKVNALIDMWYATGMLLSGVLVPIAFLPKGLAAVITYSPFPSMIAFPIDILMGRVHGAGLAQGFAIMALWLAFFIALSNLLWQHGLRRYSAVGA
jgi:ABC-2 type transport system permease protein